MTEESIFAAALGETSAAGRRAFLDRACGPDAALRRRIERLILADEEAGILDTAPDADALLSAGPPSPELATGQLFAGRFALGEKLGAGGMGEVWAAEQTEPVRRRVAVKVVRPGHDSAERLARFEQERQTLAAMDHPNIGKVFDAGLADGRPFFVMELIPGAAITRHCDERRLSVRERLELFLPVCEAVTHAHQKGVIHRDLKPANILVPLYDGRPVPKVIDFGVAKARGGSESADTETGSLIGTLEYMSPEQAGAGGLDIDTRSDIYSLGVVLYELLTGGVPFSRRGAGLAEMLRVVRDREPTRPSARLADPDAPPGVRSARRSDTKRLAAVRGELDWIVLKCLEKDRERRYATANALAADLRRYLADEPVQAGPPSARYRAGKFLRRHRGPVAAAGLIVLALVAGIVGTTAGLVQARRARAAESLRAEGERAAKVTAESRSAQVAAGVELLNSIFLDLDPLAEEKEGRPLRAILGDRLDRAVAALDAGAIDDPLVEADLRTRLGTTLLGLGRPAKAEPLFAAALATRHARLGAGHPLTLDATRRLALAQRAAGKVASAIRLLERVRDAHEAGGEVDPSARLDTLHDLARAYLLAGRASEAVPLLERVRDARPQDERPETLVALDSLATAYFAADRHAEAIDLHRRVHEARGRLHGVDHFLTLESLNNLAQVYVYVGKMTKALDLLEQARDGLSAKLGPDHPRALAVLHMVAWTYRAVGRIPDAILLAERVKDGRTAALGAAHPDTLMSLDNLALAYEADGQADKALPLYRRAAEGVEKLEFVPTHSPRLLRNLRNCLERRGEDGAAEVWRRKSLTLIRGRDGPESAAYAAELLGLGSNLLRQANYADAEPALLEALALFEKLPPGPAMPAASRFRRDPTPRDRQIEALDRLVRLYDAQGNAVEAARRRGERDRLGAPEGGHAIGLPKSR